MTCADAGWTDAPTDAVAGRLGAGIDVIAASIAAACTDAFALSRPRLDGFALGEHVVARIVADQGAFALKLLPSDAAYAAAADTLHQLLDAAAIPHPAPRRARDGSLAVPLLGRRALLNGWLAGGDGGDDDRRRAAVAVLHRRIAAALGTWPQAVAFPVAPTPTTRRAALLHDVRPTGAAAEASAKLAAVLEAGGGALEAVSRLPPSLMHEELRTDNLVFAGDRVVGVLDWDGCRRMAAIDAAAQAALWCGLEPRRGRLRPPSWAAIRAYVAVAVDDPGPPGALPALVAMHALRTAAFWPAAFAGAADGWAGLARSLLEDQRRPHRG